MRLAPFITAKLQGSTLTALLLCCHATAASPLLRSRAVVVHPNGSVDLAGRHIARLSLPPRPRRIRVQRHRLGTRCLLHVRVTGRLDGPAAELLTECAGGTPVIFAGTTGPQGRDGEWSRTLALEQQRVLLFESRPEVHLCNTRRPARLYLRKFDFETRRFRPVTSFGFPPTLPTILASRRTPRRGPWAQVLAQSPLNAFRVLALSSAGNAATTAAQVPAPTALGDGNAATTWSPASKALDGQPFLIARRPTAPYPLRAIVLTLARTPPAQQNSGNTAARRTLVLLTSSGRRFRIAIPPSPPGRRRRTDRYWIRLPEPIPTDCVTLIADHPRALDTAPVSARLHLAELRFITELDLDPRPFDTLFTDLTQGEPRRTRAALDLLAKHPEAALSQLERRLPAVSPEDLPPYLDLIPRLPIQPSARLLGQIVPRLPQAARAQVVVQLAAMGPVAEEALTALISTSPTAGALQIIAKLSTLGGPTAAAALLSTLALDRAPPRRAALGALRGFPPQQLCPLLARQPGSAPLGANRRLELLSLLPRCCPSMPGLMQAPVRELVGPTWPSAATFELRYALIRATPCLAHPAQRRLLRAAMSCSQPPLRALATQQLVRAGLAASDSTPLLLRALGDPDPGVRRAAADVARHPSTTTSSVLSLALARAAQAEKWPFVTRALAQALGRHCSSAGIQALRNIAQSNARGPDRAALDALGQCSDPSHMELALRLAEDPRRRPDLREAALGSIPEVEARIHHERLVRLYGRLRRHIHTEGDLQVAAACAQALARAGTGPAVDALVDTLVSDPQHALRTAAAAALGHGCTEQAAAALRLAATRFNHPVTARVAASSLRRCGVSQKAGVSPKAQGASDPVRKR